MYFQLYTARIKYSVQHRFPQCTVHPYLRKHMGVFLPFDVFGVNYHQPRILGKVLHRATVTYCRMKYTREMILLQRSFVPDTITCIIRLLTYKVFVYSNPFSLMYHTATWQHALINTPCFCSTDLKYITERQYLLSAGRTIL